MTARRTGRLITALLAALLILLVSRPVFSEDRAISPDMYIDPARLERLQSEGHSLTEIYTARSLEAQTGVPTERWLEGRKQGKDFSTLIRELAAGIPLEKPRRFESARNLGEALVRAFMDEGYHSSDIMECGDILAQYGGDPRALMARHQAGESWAAIRESEERRWRETLDRQAKESPGFALGIDGKAEATESGLTKAEIVAYLKQGFTLNEIMTVDTTAYLNGLDIRKIVAAKRPDQPLMDALYEALARLKPAQPTPDQQTSGGQTVRTFIKTWAGLSDEQMEALQASGLSLNEIATVESRAYVLGVDLKAVIAAMQPGEKLAEAIERAHWERPAAERAAVLKKPHVFEEMLDEYYADTTGRTVAEIRKLRGERKSWIEIKGYKSSDGNPSVYDLADSWGITDHSLLERALEMGYSSYDVRQATRVAQSLSLSMVDVLALKTPGNTWDYVVRVISTLPFEAEVPTEPEVRPEPPVQPEPERQVEPQHRRQSKGLPSQQ